MHALRLVGITEDGLHLVLTDDGSDFVLPIDAALRSALRRDTGHHVLPGHRSDEPMSPVEVQVLIRSGADAEEAAERAGWSVEKVRRYEGPILAERQHIARIAAGTRLRPKGPASGSPTLTDRVKRRLHERGVVMDAVEWDSWRSDDGQWVLELHFEESGHHRRASWTFVKTSMSVRPLDQEASRLSDDDPDLLDPGPDADRRRAKTPEQSGTRFATSYTSDYSSASATPRPHVDEDSDLMATLRSTSRASTRRRGPRRNTREVHETHDAALMEAPTPELSAEPEVLPLPSVPDASLEPMIDPAEAAVPVAPAEEPAKTGLQIAAEAVEQLAEPTPDAPESVESTEDAEPNAAQLAADIDDDRGDEVDEPEIDEADGVVDAVDESESDDQTDPDMAFEADGTSLVHDAAAPELGEDGLLLDPAADVEASENPRALAGHDEPHLPFEDAAPEFSAAPPAFGDIATTEPATSAERSTDASTAELSLPSATPPTDTTPARPVPPHPAQGTAQTPAPAAPALETPAAPSAPEQPETAPSATASDQSEPPRPRTRRRSSTTRKKAAAQPEPQDSEGDAPTPTKISRNRVVAPAGPPESAAPADEAPAAATPATPAPSVPKPAAPKPSAADAGSAAPKPGPARKQTSRRKGRASVPAWDDIMFGAKPGDEG